MPPGEPSVHFFDGLQLNRFPKWGEDTKSSQVTQTAIAVLIHLDPSSSHSSTQSQRNITHHSAKGLRDSKKDQKSHVANLSYDVSVDDHQTPVETLVRGDSTIHCLCHVNLALIEARRQVAENTVWKDIRIRLKATSFWVFWYQETTVTEKLISITV